MHGWNPLAGMIESVDVFVNSVTDADNARTLLFSALIGAMITFTQRGRCSTSAGSRGKS
jgi:hypothetical protein